MADSVDMALLLDLARQNLEQGREIRRELREIRGLALDTVEYVRRLDRRMTEMRDDLELMVKSELMGRFAFLETRLDERFGDHDDRLSTLEATAPRSD